MATAAAAMAMAAGWGLAGVRVAKVEESGWEAAGQATAALKDWAAAARVAAAAEALARAVVAAEAEEEEHPVACGRKWQNGKGNSQALRIWRVSDTQWEQDCAVLIAVAHSRRRRWWIAIPATRGTVV